MIYVDMSNPQTRDQVDKLNGIVIPEEKRPRLPQMTIPWRKDRKREPGKNRIPFLILHGAEGGI